MPPSDVDGPELRPAAPAGAEPSLEAACRTAARLLGADGAALVVAPRDDTPFVACHGLAPELVDALAGPVLASGRPVLSSDPGELDLGRSGAALRLRAYAGVPLRDAGGEVGGALCVVADERLAWAESDLAALADLGVVVEHVLRSRATSRELLDQYREQLTAVRALVHDVRQPLSSASGAAQLLGSEHDVVDHREELVDLVATGVDRADRLLLQLLEGRRGAPAPVDVAAVVDRVCRASNEVDPARIELDVAPGASVLGFVEDVERIASNLLVNAFVHGGPGVRVRVRAWRGFDGVVLEVEDDGDGVPPADRERIFGLGVRRSGTGAPGQGIGLHVVRTLARRTGGDVEVAGAVGGGALFRVRLRDLADPAAATIDVSGD